jgi:hypothetical protein
VAAPETPPRIELLRAQHDRTGFICDKETVDQYFQRQVTQDAQRHLATPFVMVMREASLAASYALERGAAAWWFAGGCRQRTAALSAGSDADRQAGDRSALSRSRMGPFPVS